MFIDLLGIPVFKAGTYHDGAVTISNADIDSIITAYNETAADFRRPVKLGHNDTKNNAATAALGTIKRVFSQAIDGVKHLMIDLEKVPEKLATAIKNRQILDRSIELYPEYKSQGTGKIYKNVLRAVALLGSDEIPEVKGLEPLENYVYCQSEPEYIIFGMNSATPGGQGVKKYEPPKTEKQEIKSMEPIKFKTNAGNILEFATAEAFKDYLQAENAKEIDALKTENAKLQAANHEKEVVASFAEICKPNEKGDALPKAVIDKALNLAKQMPVTLEFAEGDKKVSAAAGLVDLLQTVKKTGLVKFSESGKTDTTKAPDPPKPPVAPATNPDAVTEEEQRKMYDEGIKTGTFSDKITFEAFQQINGFKK